MNNMDNDLKKYNGISFMKSYLSSTVYTRDPSGMSNTKRRVNINNNGKKQSYYKEYRTDRDGIKYWTEKIFIKKINF